MRENWQMNGVKDNSKKIQLTVLVSAACLLLAACASSPVAFDFPAPTQVVAPQPIPNSQGAYLSPMTSDGVVAEWVGKAVNAKAGGSMGSLVGQQVGAQAFEMIPFIGGWLGSKAGDKIGRETAIRMSGGWDYMRSTSDLSFNSANDLAVYMYVNASAREDFADILSAVQGVYPDVQENYFQAIQNAERN